MENYLQATKRRGRPLGSKNKRKEPEPEQEPSTGVEQNVASMQLKVLEVAAGADIINAVSDFANRLRVNVSIISTHGLVCNVKIFRPNNPRRMSHIVTFEGVCNLLSLKGSFYGSLSSRIRASPFSGRHLIHFVYREGYSARGIVHDRLVAATKVFLGISIMRETDCIKLPLPPPRPLPLPQPGVCSSARGSMTAYRVPLQLCNHIANGYLCPCRFK